MTHRSLADGKKISLLGQGAMRFPAVDGGSAHGGAGKPIDQERTNRQVRYLLDHGVTYFDTSPCYCRGASEGALGAALAASGYGRESYVVATKLSNFSPTQWTLSACKRMFAASLKELRTDYIDNYLLHSIGNGGFSVFERRYLSNGALDWCCELRRERKVRNLGFSFHGDPKTFDWCIENHDRYKWDFCQIQMNYVDWNHADGRNVPARRLYEALAAKKIPVVVMEPLLGGRLARYNAALARELAPLDPGASLAKWAFRFCGSFPEVITILSGMTFESHIEENVATFSPLKPCSKEELAALERAAKAFLNLNTVPCTACAYCMPCPYGLDIPALLAFRNRVRTARPKMKSREILRLYEKSVPEPLRRADHCTACQRCATHCPQSIDIPKEIAEIDSWIDNLREEVSR